MYTHKYIVLHVQEDQSNNKNIEKIIPKQYEHFSQNVFVWC